MSRIRYIGVLVLLLVSVSAFGQKFSVSTNIVGYMNLGTMNMEVSYAPVRHWSLTAQAKYNPFSFKISDRPVRNRQQAYSVGARFWPWHIYSGWWVAAKLQYQEYSTGGILSRKTEEGDRWGAGLTAGYTYMIHPRVNLEFGLGFWTGVKKYAAYDSPVCGLTVESGLKAFILPNDIIIAVSYVF